MDEGKGMLEKNNKSDSNLKKASSMRSNRGIPFFSSARSIERVEKLEDGESTSNLAMGPGGVVTFNDAGEPIFTESVEE